MVPSCPGSLPVSAAVAVCLVFVIPIAASVEMGPIPSRPAAPAQMAPGATTSAWPDFLGPGREAVITETPLAMSWPAGGPPLVWSTPKGSGYAGCTIADGRLVLFHRLGEEEVIECRDAVTGVRRWRRAYPTGYRDRFGYTDGPRATPVIDGPRIYTLGAAGQLDCRRLDTGEVVWRMDIVRRFGLRQGFFGVGSTPLVEKRLLVLNVGAPMVAGGSCVVALDKTTGKVIWRAGNRWGASYASPVAATVFGQRRIFVLAGGESRPPVGGLLCIDPADGRLDFRFPWRSGSYESVNAANPLVFDRRVLITASYGTGAALLSIGDDFSATKVWTSDDLGAHFATPLHYEGYVYGIDGRHAEEAAIVCLDASTGKLAWRFAPTWEERYQAYGRPQRVGHGIGRGTLLRAGAHFLCLGEHGHLLWLALGPERRDVLARTWLFAAADTWTPPSISHGLLYVMQHRPDTITEAPPRLLCYDLRGR